MPAIVFGTTAALMVVLSPGVSAFVPTPAKGFRQSLKPPSPIHSTVTTTKADGDSATATASGDGNNDEEAIRRRASTAKETWSAIAMEPTSDRVRHKIDLLDPNSGKVRVLRDPLLFQNFANTIRGTYFVNGLSSCQIGDRLVHPFEAHGFCKSFVFDGDGSLEVTSRNVETPLAVSERSQNKVINRGVMSTVASMDNPLGVVQNALSSSERDTANLTADLWPPPKKKNGQSTPNSIDPLLIVTTDNGEPYAVDPKTLETKGRLCDVLPKLEAIFNPPSDKSEKTESNKFLAHTRYDAERNRFVMCINTMVIPGDDFKGNSQMEFLEFDENFDLVSRRKHTTRFMVFHDWVLTQNYYVVPKNPAYLKWKNIMKFAFGASLGTDVFAMEEETNGEFILIPRFDTEEPVRDVKCDAFFNCFHFGPSFEQTNPTSGKTEMVIHGCVFDHYTFGGEMGFNGVTQEFDPISWGDVGGLAPPPRLDKFVINMETFHLEEKTRIPMIPVDMPCFEADAVPLGHSYFLGASRPEGWFPFRQIVKLDLETHESFVYDAGDHSVTSEPIFVPRDETTKHTDDGYVMSIIHNAQEKDSFLTIWDSKTFEQGPIAEVSLDMLFPWCVHGSFHPDYNPYNTNDASL